MKTAFALLIVLSFAGVVSAQAIQLQQPKSEWDSGYFKNATVGDFATYVDVKGNIFRHVEIGDVGDRQVTVNVSRGPGTQVFTQVLRFAGPENSKPNFGQPKLSRATLLVGTEKIDCQLTEYLDGEGKVTRRIWKSPTAPLDGLVKDDVVKLDADGKEFVSAGQALIGFKYAKAPK